MKRHLSFQFKSVIPKHDILLKGRTVLGILQLVKSVNPVKVKRREIEEGPTRIDRDFAVKVARQQKIQQKD